jgi:hypothetical protein
MKKFLIWVLSIIIIGALLAYGFYRFYLPDVVVNAITSGDELPDYLPENVRNKIAPYKETVNKSADQVIRELHERNIPVTEAIEAINQVNPEHIMEAVAEINTQNIRTTDEAFDIIKKHFPAEFDMEALREPFNDNVNMKMINKAVNGLNANKNAEIDLDMTKEIATKVLAQKEKEYQKNSGGL